MRSTECPSSFSSFPHFLFMDYAMNLSSLMWMNKHTNQPVHQLSDRTNVRSNGQLNPRCRYKTHHHNGYLQLAPTDSSVITARLIDLSIDRSVDSMSVHVAGLAVVETNARCRVVRRWTWCSSSTRTSVVRWSVPDTVTAATPSAPAWLGASGGRAAATCTNWSSTATSRPSSSPWYSPAVSRW